ncbi:hypothetical protein FB45DRAFT_998929 [Roridomyces roridus]|uniref:F-box domain-containing protein n=1 Tax=Roridomyces roridus TaxID=1738132 RepID=A0AAD7CH66_9AGAR|nr:hypothetical protein FB45DRAFT_998929 [Roridomyces roridus]
MDATTIPQHLLTSNIAPLDAELTILLQAIADTEARLQVLHETAPERDALVARAEQYKAILSPVRRVPPELVCEVLAMVPCTRKIGSQTVDQPPWKLGHVCRSWRHWALGCPWLWCSFSIVHRKDDFREDFPLVMLETQILRAATVPLSIDFHWLKGDGLEGTFFWDLLLPLCHRWKSLCMKFPHLESAESLLDLLHSTKDHLSSLATVELMIRSEGDPEWQAVERDLFSTAPRLRELLLSDVCRVHYSPNMSAPWSQITRYRAVQEGPQILHMLQNSPNLVECSLGFDSLDELDATHHRIMVVVPHLRRLSVDSSIILAYITAPSLEHLSTDGRLSCALSFVQRSSCRLKSLAIGSVSDVDSLVPLLEACSSVEQLVLCGGTPVPTFLFDLNLCPNLTLLGFGLRCFPDTTWKESLFQMIETRYQTGRLRAARVYRVDARFTDTFLDEMRVAIENLANEGLDIEYLEDQNEFIDHFNEFSY